MYHLSVVYNSFCYLIIKIGAYMESLRYLYRIGHGPSSSHTMGPRIAADDFRSKTPEASFYQVTLYGSLAATGKGHCTDVTIIEALSPVPAEIQWKPETSLPFHPNGVTFSAYTQDKTLMLTETYFSIGGGEVIHENESRTQHDTYASASIESLLQWANSTGVPLWQYVTENEDDTISDYMPLVWKTMQQSIERGLHAEGTLPGELRLERKSRSVFIKVKRNDPAFQRIGMLTAYALAVSEENAAGSIIVTAPTCGSAGVLPSVLKYLKDYFSFTDDVIVRALMTAGIFGNIVKTNASISGALVGCQGEVGTACAMAAAAAAYLIGGSNYQIEYAAEMGLEHHLGLTCDPVLGLVQIPCIERNAIAAARALDCAEYALLSDGRHRIPFDNIVSVMKQTGLDMNPRYKETSEGGLAGLKQ